jgi:hypothetical protein
MRSARRKQQRALDKWGPEAQAQAQIDRQSWPRCAICRHRFKLENIKREWRWKYKVGSKYLCGHCAWGRNTRYVVQAILFAETLAKRPCERGLETKKERKKCRCLSCGAARWLKADKKALLP